MNPLLQWLSGGDLRSDGLANEVVAVILENPELFDDLWQGLLESDDVVRGRTADALEKIARSRPKLLLDHLPELIQIAKTDDVAMVRWHVAMILGHLAFHGAEVEAIMPALLDLLQDQSVFVRSWAIASLCIVARRNPEQTEEILIKILPLQHDASVAIRSRAGKAVDLLLHADLPLPAGWVKGVQ